MERRSYQQFCGLAKALDHVGERWTLLIVRNLLLGPRRYGELLRELPGVTTNLLAKRLKELEALGIVERRARSGSDRAELYALSEAGAALEPVIMELARWGGRFMDKPASGDTLNIAWGLLSLKRRYLGGALLSVELVIGARHFELMLSERYLSVQEREATRPAVVLRGDEAAFRSLFWGGAPFLTLRKRGEIEVKGDETRVREFLGAFQGLSSSRGARVNPREVASVGAKTRPST